MGEQAQVKDQSGNNSNKKPLSLRLRLSLFFTLALVVAWVCAAIIVWRESDEYINEFFDTQQMLFAQRLAAADFSDTLQTNHKKVANVKINKKNRGYEDDDALRFALFSLQGDLLLSDRKSSKSFIFRPSFSGFENAPIKGDDDLWRIVWLPSEDGQFIVAVGQELDYRQDMALDMLEEQLLPWLILLPVLLAGLFWMLSRELSPLRSVSQQLKNRNPQTRTPIQVQRLPAEVLPLVTSLNQLFQRTGEMIDRERTFIADAAHELRTPLAGLRVQAEVAKLTLDDPQELKITLDKLIQGIDRSSRLAEQLLLLSRIEALQQSSSNGYALENSELTHAHLDWANLLQETLNSYRPLIEKKHIALHVQQNSLPAVENGFPSLITMLLRNLLDNAVSYTPEGGSINITVEAHLIKLENTSHPISKEVLEHIGERFYRPPGQVEAGSGLGLSIIQRIAEIHGFKVEWAQKATQLSTQPTQAVFEVSVYFN